MAFPAPRSFLVTVHEPGSAVVEDLRTGRQTHVAELAGLGPLLVSWVALEAGSLETPPRPLP